MLAISQATRFRELGRTMTLLQQSVSSLTAKDET